MAILARPQLPIRGQLTPAVAHANGAFGRGEDPTARQALPDIAEIFLPYCRSGFSRDPRFDMAAIAVKTAPTLQVGTLVVGRNSDSVLRQALW